MQVGSHHPPSYCTYLFELWSRKKKILSYHVILSSVRIILIPNFPCLLCTVLDRLRKKLSWTYPGINDELFHSCSRLLRSSSWWQVKRANHLKGKMNNLSEGASCRKFFQQSWTLAVSKGKIVPQLWRAVRVMPGSLWPSCRWLQVSSTVLFSCQQER